MGLSLRDTLRIHLGHHFYGAGNLGDDFMLAGFLGTMTSLLPDATYTACVPFPLDPLRTRFPEVDWRPYDAQERAACIRAADVWLGLGGSPFQSAQSRWFVDHLIEDAGLCRSGAKPMFYLGVGVQAEAELATGEIAALCQQAQFIWTRDQASAARLAAASAARIKPAADLAHLYFRTHRPPPARRNRLTLVANFDYGTWPGLTAALAAIDRLPVSERVWLAQESRALPGAERNLFASLPAEVQGRWRLVVPDEPAPVAPNAEPPPELPASNARIAAAAVAGFSHLDSTLARWPSGEWLLTSRFHAALAGAWAGSRIVVITTNEKLRAAAEVTGAATISPTASEAEVNRALLAAAPAATPVAQAESAYAACADFSAAASRAIGKR